MTTPTDRKRVYVNKKAKSSSHIMATGVESHSSIQLTNANHATSTSNDRHKRSRRDPSNIPLNPGFATSAVSTDRSAVSTGRSAVSTDRSVNQELSNFRIFKSAFTTNLIAQRLSNFRLKAANATRTRTSMSQRLSNFLPSIQGFAKSAFGADTKMDLDSTDFPCSNPSYTTSPFGGISTDFQLENPGCATSAFGSDTRMGHGSNDIPCLNPSYTTSPFGGVSTDFSPVNPGCATSAFGSDTRMGHGSNDIPCLNPNYTTSPFGGVSTDFPPVNPGPGTSAFGTDTRIGHSSTYYIPCSNPGYATDPFGERLADYSFSNPGPGTSAFGTYTRMVHGSTNIPCSNLGYVTDPFGERLTEYPFSNPGPGTSAFGTYTRMIHGSTNIPCSNLGYVTDPFGERLTDYPFSNPGCATTAFGTDTNIPCSNAGFSTSAFHSGATSLFGINRCMSQALSSPGCISGVKEQPKELSKATDQRVLGTANYPGGVFYYDKGSLHCKFSNSNDQISSTDFNCQKNLLPYALSPFERSSTPIVASQSKPELSKDSFIRVSNFNAPNYKLSLKNNSRIKVKSYASMQKPFNCEVEKPLRSSLYNIHSYPMPTKWISRSMLNPATNVKDEIPISCLESDRKQANMRFEPHPTGIVLKRHDYFTIPSLDELIELINCKDRSCKVQNFIIGRKGYGQVMFPGLCDVLGLNIDEIVHFDTTTLLVYPMGTKKPPMGCGLNRRALITLYKVIPDEFHNSNNYHEELRRISKLQGSRFIDYRSQTETWVFEVDHFSKYGLSRSSSSKESNLVSSTPFVNVEYERQTSSGLKLAENA